MRCKLCEKEIKGDPFEGEYCSQVCWEYSDVAEKINFNVPDQKFEGQYIAFIGRKLVFPKFPVSEPGEHIVTIEDKGRYYFAFECNLIGGD